MNDFHDSSLPASHGARPWWADAHAVRLPPDAPELQRWEAVQALLPPLAALLGVEIVITDTQGVCVGGTGPFGQGIGLRVPQDNALAYSLRTGQSTMVLHPGEEDVCRSCSGRASCTDMANFTGPVLTEGRVVAVIQVVAFTEGQRAQWLVKAEKAFDILRQIVGVAWAAQPEGPSADTVRHAESRFPGLIGESEPMRQLRKAILKAAGTAATVLVQGESGTGKELVARAVHANSRFRNGPFVAVNCGAIPESLMESELFGYEAGAFSGARREGRAGLLEQAQGGTFFLDEVSEMPPALQVKLLRVLQERTVRHIGGKTDRAVEVRVIAASNKNLRELVRQGRFREDLFFRLDVIPLFVPPLRERPGDVRLLTTRFLQQFSRDLGRTFRVAAPLMHMFERHSWPGNVRELKNFVEYGVGFSENGVLTPQVLASRFAAAPEAESPVTLSGTVSEATGGLPDRAGAAVPLPPQYRKERTAPELEALLDMYGRHTEGKRAVARHVGISLATLYRRLKAGAPPGSGSTI